jgi:hypothetical protein
MQFSCEAFASKKFYRLKACLFVDAGNPRFHTVMIIHTVCCETVQQAATERHHF